MSELEPAGLNVTDVFAVTDLLASVHGRTTPATADMDREEAERYTIAIEATTGLQHFLLAQVHDRKGWKAMGYRSFSAYVDEALPISRQHAYRLIDLARVQEAIDAAAGELSPVGDNLTERDARLMKGDLPAIADAIRGAITEAGEDPAAQRAAAERTLAREVEERQRQAAADRTYLTGPTPEPAPEPASATAAPEHDPAPGGGAHITEPPARSDPDEAVQGTSSAATAPDAAEASPGEAEGTTGSPGQPEKPTPAATTYRRARTRAVSALREMGDPRKVWTAGNAADRDALVDAAREMQAWADQIMALDKKARRAS